MNKIEDKQLANEMHPLIRDAVENNFYDLDSESFFLQKIIAPIKFSRQRDKIRNGHEDRKILKSYFKHISPTLIPTNQLLQEIKFISEGKNSDLKNEFKNNIHKVFTTKLLMWAINEANEVLTQVLSKGMHEGINDKTHNINDVINNLFIIKNEDKKRVFLAEIYMTKDINNYLLLDKCIALNQNDKKNIIERIIINNTDAMLLNRDVVKEIIIEKVLEKEWGIVDTYMRNLNINKIDFLLDILNESKEETQENINRDKINTAIFKLIDKVLSSKKEDLIDRIIQIKEQQPLLTNNDIYILMIKRMYSYLKKEKAQQYVNKIMEVAKKNGDFEKIKATLFYNTEQYKIESLNIVFNLQEEYLKKEMKEHFMHYLEEKLQPKNGTVKLNKI